MEPKPTLPVLPRLDRLDRLLELLEEKHNKSRSDDDNEVYKQTFEDNPNCKPLLSALDDVHHKGNLIDRLTALENRVLQLALHMEEGSTSRSSSTTAYPTKEEKESPIDKCATKSIGKEKRRSVYFKWMGCFHMRC